MDLLDSIIEEGRKRLEEAVNSVSKEDTDGVIMQLCLFQSLKEEFSNMVMEKERLLKQNVKLKEKVKESTQQKDMDNKQKDPLIALEKENKELKNQLSQCQEPSEQGQSLKVIAGLEDQVRSSQEKIANLESCFESMERLQEENLSLHRQLQDLVHTKNKQEDKIKELSSTVDNCKLKLQELKMENKTLGKMSLNSVLDTVDNRKIQEAGRLSFLLQVNDEQALWLQFRKEKQWLQCSNCGRRNHARGQCAYNSPLKLEISSSKIRVYFQSCIKNRKSGSEDKEGSSSSTHSYKSYKPVMHKIEPKTLHPTLSASNHSPASMIGHHGTFFVAKEAKDRIKHPSVSSVGLTHDETHFDSLPIKYKLKEINKIHHQDNPAKQVFEANISRRGNKRSRLINKSEWKGKKPSFSPHRHDKRRKGKQDCGYFSLLSPEKLLKRPKVGVYDNCFSDYESSVCV